MMRAIAAIVLANLPVRWWGPFEERLPVHRYAWISGLVLTFTGLAIGIPGYFAFMAEAADGFNRGIGVNPDLGIKSTGWGLAGLPVFILATPTGLISTYLGITGMARAISAYIVDEVHGDFLLTWLDASLRVIGRRLRAYGAANRRQALEGAAVPDRLVTGEQAGHPDFELVLLASRRKPGWETNSYLVESDGTAYRVGEAFDLTIQAGLRTAYPLTKLRGGEAIRHSIPYELPPLWRGPMHKRMNN